MKAVVSILLLTIHLFTATEVSQLIKLPVLFEHYNEHKQEEASITFASFLYRHYFTDHSNDGHPDRDSQLPFHSHEHCSGHQLVVLPTHYDQVISLPVLPVEQKQNFSFSDQCIPLVYLSCIWQPPKAA